MLRRFLKNPLIRTGLTKNTRNVRYVSNLSENEFLSMWEDYQEDMVDKLEEDELSTKVEDFSETAESITIECEEERVFVINRHVANREIW